MVNTVFRRKAMAWLVIAVFAVTSMFGTGTAFATEETAGDITEADFTLTVTLMDEDFGNAISLDEYLEDAKTEDGATITVPYGTITDHDGNDDNVFYFDATLPEETDIVSLSSMELIEDEDIPGWYGQEIKVNADIEGKLDYQITAEMSEGDDVTYTFHFVEDDGSSIELEYLSVEYQDENGEGYSIEVDLEKAEGSGDTIVLPAYYDDSKGFSLYHALLSPCTSNIQPSYKMGGNSKTVGLTFTSANGAVTKTYTLILQKDTDVSSAALDYITAFCRDAYDGEETEITCDLNSVSPTNELYLEIPSYYCDEEGDINEAGDMINVKIRAKGSARLVSSNGGWESLSEYLWYSNYEDFELRDSEDESYWKEELTFGVMSADGKTRKSYTLCIIRTDCWGNHTMHSNSQEDPAASCTEPGLRIRPCQYCYYEEKEIIPALGHKFSNWTVALEATCESVGRQYRDCVNEDCELREWANIAKLPHDIGRFEVTKAAGFGTTGLKIASCINCDYKKTEATPAVADPILSFTSKTYTGKEIKPPTVTLKTTDGKLVPEHAYWTETEKLAWEIKNVGTYKLTVQMDDSEYVGKKTMTFKVNPKGVSISKLSKGKKSFTVKWKKPAKKYLKQTKGYQIRYSTSKNFKNAKTITIKKNNTTSKQIKKLKAKKKYYVQIRTYKNGCYSAWSKTKTVKTK